MRLAALLCCALMIGCGKPVATTTAVPATFPKATYPDPVTKFQGMNAKQWGERAKDADYATADRAFEALAQLKGEGIPFLVEAFLVHAKAGRQDHTGMCVTRTDGNTIALADLAQIVAILDQGIPKGTRGFVLLHLERAGQRASFFLPKIQIIENDPSEDQLTRQAATNARRKIEAP